MSYTEEEARELRKMEHEKVNDTCIVEWVFPQFGCPVLTFDRITYYNAYRDRDELSEEQLRILREEGPLGCPLF